MLPSVTSSTGHSEPIHILEISQLDLYCRQLVDRRTKSDQSKYGKLFFSKYKNLRNMSLH